MEICKLLKVILIAMLCLMWCLTLANILFSFKEIKELNKKIKDNKNKEQDKK